MNRSSHSPERVNRKVAVMGYPYVGKSALVQRFAQNIFPEKYDSTIEDQHQKHLTFYQRDYNIRVIDTAGQQEFTVFPRSCSLDVNGFILVYAIDDKKSFEMLSYIYDKILRTYGDPDLPMILVGNKLDLHSQRAVTFKEGEALAREWNVRFMEVCARELNKVNELFETMLREIEINRGNIPASSRPERRHNGGGGHHHQSRASQRMTEDKNCSIC